MENVTKKWTLRISNENVVGVGVNWKYLLGGVQQDIFGRYKMN
jgi:hypothetical protein